MNCTYLILHVWSLNLPPTQALSDGDMETAQALGDEASADQVAENVLDLKISLSSALVPRAKLAFVVLGRRAFSTHGRNLALKQVLTSCQF